MTYTSAFKILELPSSPSPTHDAIRKQYRALSLKYHPDKNPNSPDAHDQFILVSEAYHFLMNEPETFTKSPILEKYNDLLFSFFNSVLNNRSEYNEKIYSILRQILTLCEHNAVELLKRINRDTLKYIYNLLITYKDILHVSDDFLCKMAKIVTEEDESNQILYILNPDLKDLFENNLYRLTHLNKPYIIPLWHHELIYDVDNYGEMYVQCFPILPDHITIDEDNHIHVNVRFSVSDIFDNPVISIELYPGKTLELYPDELFFKKEQNVCLKNCGIPCIHYNEETMNIYDVSIKSNIYIYLHIDL
jgi:curved DNA-binding protein CbpA